MTQDTANYPGASGAQIILQGFDSFHQRFKAITQRAKTRFEQRDWGGMQKDAVERLELREKIVNGARAELKSYLGNRARYKAVWVWMKTYYSELTAGRPDRELAETFFNSVTRRIFGTVGVDPDIEYVSFDFGAPLARPKTPIFKLYYRRSTTSALVKEILQDYSFKVGYVQLDTNCALAGAEIEAHLRTVFGHRPVIDVAEMVTTIFYRNKGAYLVGRLRVGSQIVPLAFALLNLEQGVVIDAVLLTDDDLSVLFSFTRSYFHVDVEEPRALITFLKSIIPLKRIAELYISIGYYKHGKTELYRDFMQHLAQSADRFEIAKGERGMVMVVFTLPSYDIVFKVIKDRFSQPKKTTRQKVMDRYQLVFRHDRAGRLVDTQEFEHLAFQKDRFSPELLAELLQVAAHSVIVQGDTVIIKHLYTERRLTPLNLYLKDAGPAAARDVVIDCGKCIKDLAATNIFPGDFLLKNFGVTRHDRVVFYDYDELCFVTDCNFRKIPPARDFYEEFEAQPWFYADEADIFPEEFKTFLGLSGRLLEIFTAHHQDLFEVEFWQEMQARHRAGEAMDIFPYKLSKRLLHHEPMFTE
ncbi:MAG: isocitrate dehydrogenase kinase/phosphatase [Chloroflexota bacterium]|nr:MAG: isocitrate dehydrogenase kinase/phosphatase [Chloroflexota bacterium]